MLNFCYNGDDKYAKYQKCYPFWYFVYFCYVRQKRICTIQFCRLYQTHYHCARFCAVLGIAEQRVHPESCYVTDPPFTASVIDRDISVT